MDEGKAKRACLKGDKRSADTPVLLQHVVVEQRGGESLSSRAFPRREKNGQLARVCGGNCRNLDKLPLPLRLGGIICRQLVLSDGQIAGAQLGRARRFYKLLPRGDQGEERTLGLLQHKLMTAITELHVAQGWRASCSNMSSSSSSDKECRVLKGEEEEEEDTSTGKEGGSKAGQPANQQADCGKQKSTSYYQWRLRHE